MTVKIDTRFKTIKKDIYISFDIWYNNVRFDTDIKKQDRPALPLLIMLTFDFILFIMDMLKSQNLIVN